MNLLEQVCKELGVEIGEEWEGNDGKVYTIKDNRIIEYYEPAPENYSDTDYVGWIVSDYKVCADILQGKLKPIWEPKKGEEFFIPEIDRFEANRCTPYNWIDDESDNWYLSKGLVFKTREEAIECANKMLEAVGDING